jgi:hypothetical protein
MTSTDVWLCLHCFNGWKGREIGWGPTDWSTGVLWIGMGALFLESSGSAQLCWQLRKRLPHMTYHEHVHVMCIRFLLQDIHQFGSLWLSDMSNCLSCRCHQIVCWAHERNIMDWKLLKLCLFANSCLISSSCSLVKMNWVELKYESKDLLVVQVCA